MTETHSQNRPLGYTRVSTYGQTLDSQDYGDSLRDLTSHRRNILLSSKLSP